MKRVRYYCDRCGAEIENAMHICRISFEYDDKYFPHECDEEYEVMEVYQDLCPDCTHKITRFIMNKENVDDKEN